MAVLFTNARNLGFSDGVFDIALCGFMGWDDCFDFIHLEFTQPDTKAQEIRRVLRDGGKFICCLWDAQEDLAWMEAAMLRHYPALLQDSEFLQQRPIGMSYEKALGYEVIFHAAGFRNIEVSWETGEFVSTDEEEWWQEMGNIGWDPYLNKITQVSATKLLYIKNAVFTELQSYKQSDGIHFNKSAFYVCGVK
jgi:SAM-dependent methyltransferase